MIKNIEAIPTEGLDSATKEGLSKFIKEVIPEIRQIIKTQEDDAVRAKFNPEELKKALIDPSRSDREKINLVEMAKKQIKEELDEKAGKVAKGELVKQGEGFTMKDGGKPYQYAQQTFKPEQWINDLSGILTDEWAANLKSLAVKHPEMFKSEADVFRAIKEIKNNPTHFLENTKDDVALIAKRLNDNKAANIGVQKETGKIIHANKTDGRDLNRLVNRQKRLRKEKGKPTATPAAATSLKKEDGELLKSPNKPIIPQKLKNASIDEWQSEISKARDNWNGLKRLMDQIKQNETLGQNERAKLYVDISDRMKKLREAER